MDPTVIAAIITSPTAVIAAAAAYAAGRRQASGAHRGPVDAVRRQHQRDAYATLLVAANDYLRGTGLAHCRMQASQEVPNVSRPDYRDTVRRRAHEIRRERATTGFQELSVPLAVVSLEGPEHVAERAKDVESAAQEVARTTYLASLSRSIGGNGRDESGPAQTVLLEAIAAFTLAARDHLNRTDS
ncbi:hypothetical protein ACFVFF_37050 [Streptomyces sp. NPDC057680]|uniref:hypothetical protein n=1 Tax=Streptomyces sp. NPDC057680 TaxID=3346208 RepID=UPI0036C3DBFF